MTEPSTVIVVYADTLEELRLASRLAESLRKFGGRFDSTPIWLYCPFGLVHHDRIAADKLFQFHVAICHVDIPTGARWIFKAGKVYAAADAECFVECNSTVVLMDPDTIILREPALFELPSDHDLLYCPVMHNRSGSLADQPPDPFWKRTYELLSLDDSVLFPMTTAADRQIVRAYFNAGLVISRAGSGVMRQWENAMNLLAEDASIAEFCRAERKNLIFLHQMALTGLLRTVSRSRMQELPDDYNFPLFFDKQYGAARSYCDITSVTTLREVVSDECLAREWPRLIGPVDKVDWLRFHMLPD